LTGMWKSWGKYKLPKRTVSLITEKGTNLKGRGKETTAQQEKVGEYADESKRAGRRVPGLGYKKQRVLRNAKRRRATGGKGEKRQGLHEFRRLEIAFSD